MAAGERAAAEAELERTLRGAKAIVFDAGNTILSINYRVVADAIGAASGRAVTEDEAREAEWRARPRFDARLAGLRSTETVPAFRAYCDAIFEGLGLAPGRAADAAYERIRAYNAASNLWDTPLAPARDALADVARAGYAVGVISNSRGTIEAHLRTLGLAEDLRFVLDSGVVGIEKPDARLFAMARERLPLEAAADRCVYVGDLFSIDVLGARAAGWRAVLIDPAGAWGERGCARVTDVGKLRDVAVALAREEALRGPSPWERPA